MIYQFPNPMKIWSAKDDAEIAEALASDNYAAQLKIDGASYTLVKDETGTAHLYSGTISKKDGFPIDKIENVPHIRRFIEGFFPNESSLVAEIYTHINYADGTFHDREKSTLTNTIMLCGGDKAAQRQEKYGPINCYVFDILEWGGEDMAKLDFAQRDAILDELFETFPANEWLSKADTVYEDKQGFLSDALSNGCEGIVLKMLHSQGKISAAHPVVEIGETAKRPAHSTIKIKEVDTIDAVIINTTEPEKVYKGKDPENYPYRDAEGNPVNRLFYLGMINAFVIGAYDENGELVEIGTVASGLDDDMRLDAKQHPDLYMGQVVEITCMSIDKEEKTLRHPRLTRVRFDKAAQDCKMEDIFK